MLDALLASGSGPMQAAIAIASGGIVDPGRIEAMMREAARASFLDPDRCETIAKALLAPERAASLGWEAVYAAIHMTSGIADLRWLRESVLASGWEKGCDGEQMASSSLIRAVLNKSMLHSKLSDSGQNLNRDAFRGGSHLSSLADCWRVAARPGDRQRIEGHIRSLNIDPAWLALGSAHDGFRYLRATDQEDLAGFARYARDLCLDMGGDMALLDDFGFAENPILSTAKPVPVVRPGAMARDAVERGQIIFEGSVDLSRMAGLRFLKGGQILVGGDLILDGLADLECLPEHVHVRGRIYARGCDKLRVWFNGDDGNDAFGGNTLNPWPSGIKAEMGGVVW
jgi:hypothetical protein